MNIIFIQDEMGEKRFVEEWKCFDQVNNVDNLGISISQIYFRV
jgi:hypothetical protein